MKKIIQIGKPVHFRPNNNNITACGLIGNHVKAYDPRDVECINCINTKVYKAATQPTEY